MSKYKDVINEINKASTIAIFTHKKPDGDCLGTASALKQALEKMGKNADIFCDYEVPSNYNFIKYMNVINSQNFDKYDLGMAVDCTGENRLGDYITLFHDCASTVKFDHHFLSDDFAKVNYLEIVGSAAELMYGLIKELNVAIDKDIAIALYAGVSSDTGCFLHDNTRVETHEIAADLMRCGVDIDTANYYLFKRRTLSQLKLLQEGIKNMRILEDGKLVISGFTLKDMDTLGVNQNDTMGIVNTVANLDTAEVGVLITEEKPNLYACSFRANRDVNVANIAKVFGGGGHIKSSGAKIYGSFNTVVKKIQEAYLSVITE